MTVEKLHQSNETEKVAHRGQENPSFINFEKIDWKASAKSLSLQSSRIEPLCCTLVNVNIFTYIQTLGVGNPQNNISNSLVYILTKNYDMKVSQKILLLRVPILIFLWIFACFNFIILTLEGKYVQKNLYCKKI